MNNEPVITIASIQAAIGAIIGLLVAFNAWHPTDVQTGAIFTFYGVAAPILFGLWARGKVTPVVAPE